MGGSEAPVITNSGSGNQGITASVPVYVYEREAGCDYDKIIRALVLSNLIVTYIKSEIGTLSAFCGVVSAAAGTGAGVAFLKGAGKETIAQTLNNALSNLSGVIYDGAKASCAYKVSSSVESCFLAGELAMNGNIVLDGAGVISSDVDSTISAIGIIGNAGMRETDRVILGIMTGNAGGQGNGQANGNET